MKRFLAWRLKKSPSAIEQSPRCTAIPSAILSLPIEILELIVSHLEYDFGLAFSLTCKYMYNIFFHSIQSSSLYHPKNSPRLLHLLDRDQTDLLLCEYHYKFYAWSRQKKNEYRCPGCQEPPYSTVSVALCGPCCRVPTSRYINKETRRLMLRYVFHGPLSGIPPVQYNHSCPIIGEGNNRVEIRVVENKLMVRRTLTVQMLIDPVSNLVRDTSFLSICLHSTPGYHGLLLAAVGHVSAVERNLGISNDWLCPFLFKCKECATDVRLGIRQGTRRTAAIEFDVYQDLGGISNTTLQQRQVLCDMGSLESKIQYPGEIVQVQRLKEDIGRQFHSAHEHETAFEETPDRTFLDQWDPSVKDDRWVYNFSNTANSTPVWVRYPRIPFSKPKESR